MATHLPCQNSLDRVHRLYISSFHLWQMIRSCILLQHSKPTYVKRTQLLWGKETKLLVAIIKPHKAISSSMVAQWLKSLLETSGIDTSIFSAHSVRGASSSAVVSTDISTAEILKAANWKSESVLQRLYYRSTNNSSYGRAVLSQHSATNNTVDMGD